MRHAFALALVAGVLCAPAPAAGAGWTAAAPQLHPESQRFDDLVIQPGGWAWTASRSLSGSEVLVSERRPGEGFGPPQLVGRGLGGPKPSFAEVPGEPPFLVWEGHVAHRGGNGAWTAEANGFGTGVPPRLDSLPGGGVMAVWREGTELLARVRPAGGGDFGPAQVLLAGLPQDGGRALDVAASGDGRVVAAWSETVIDRDPATGNERATATLYLASGVPGTAWDDPVVLDAVRRVAPASEQESGRVDARFAPVEIEAEPGGGWLLVAEAATERRQQSETSRTGYLKAWDGVGAGVQASEQLDQSAPIGLRSLVVEPSGGAFVWWRRGGSYRPAGGAGFPGPDGSEVEQLAHLGGDRWNALRIDDGQPMGGPLTLATFAAPLGPVALEYEPDAGVRAFSGDGAGHVLLAFSGRYPGARLRLYDEVPPVVADLRVPAAARRGAAVALSVRASDPWSGVDVSWDFGDGSTAKGQAVEHAYARPGRYAVKVDAVDAAGNRTAETREIEITAPPPVVEPPVVDRLAPVVRRLRVTTARRRPVVRLRLSEGAKLDVRLHRLARGVRRAGRCRTSRAERRRRGRACVRAVPVRRFELAVAAGDLKRTLSRRLARGRYRATVRATDAAGNRSAAVRTTFRVRR